MTEELARYLAIMADFKPILTLQTICTFMNTSTETLAGGLALHIKPAGRV